MKYYFIHNFGKSLFIKFNTVLKTFFSFEFETIDVKNYSNANNGEYKKKEFNKSLLIFLIDLANNDSLKLFEKILESLNIGYLQSQFFLFNYKNQNKFIEETLSKYVKNTSYIFLFGDKDYKGNNIDESSNTEIIFSILLLLSQGNFDLEKENDFYYFIQNNRNQAPVEKIYTFQPRIYYSFLTTYINKAFLSKIDVLMKIWCKDYEGETNSFGLTNVSSKIDYNLITFQANIFTSVTKPNINIFLNNYAANHYNKRLNEYIKNMKRNMIHSINEKIKSFNNNLEEEVNIFLKKEIEAFSQHIRIGILSDKEFSIHGFIKLCKNKLEDISSELNNFDWNFKNFFPSENIKNGYKQYLTNANETALRIKTFLSKKNLKKMVVHWSFTSLILLAVILIVVALVNGQIYFYNIFDHLLLSLTSSFVIVSAYFIYKYFALRKKFYSLLAKSVKYVNNSVNNIIKKLPLFLEELIEHIIDLKLKKKFYSTLYAMFKRTQLLQELTINEKILRSQPEIMFKGDFLKDITNNLIDKDITDNLQNSIKENDIKEILRSFIINSEKTSGIKKEFYKLSKSIKAEFILNNKNKIQNKFEKFIGSTKTSSTNLNIPMHFNKVNNKVVLEYITSSNSKGVSFNNSEINIENIKAEFNLFKVNLDLPK